MASLILICQRCSTQTAADQMQAGHCAACQIEVIANANRAELIRLLRKRLRYQRAGIPLDHLHTQLGRLLGRLRTQIDRITQDGTQTQRQLTALRQSAEAEAQKGPGQISIMAAAV
jgi:hypothetical protein